MGRVVPAFEKIPDNSGYRPNERVWDPLLIYRRAKHPDGDAIHEQAVGQWFTTFRQFARVEVVNVAKAVQQFCAFKSLRVNAKESGPDPLSNCIGQQVLGRRSEERRVGKE